MIKKKNAKGGFKILIADAEGKYSKETISKIKFKYKKKKPFVLPRSFDTK